MAGYAGQYGDSDMRRQNDEYGNTIRQTDEFGNPVQQTGYGTGGYGAGTGGGAGALDGLGYGGDQQQQLRGERRGVGGGGDTIRQMDEFGDPVQQTGYGTGGYGAGTGGAAGATGGLGYGGDQQLRGERRGGLDGGVLQRSGSSSSSEDDGQGGRRKKGIKDKIKDKIPGMGNDDEQQMAGSYPTSTTAGGGYGAELGQQQEKKGMMDKIMEKLPGHH